MKFEPDDVCVVGHVIPEKNEGKTDINNLRRICFKKTYYIRNIHRLYVY